MIMTNDDDKKYDHNENNESGIDNYDNNDNHNM